MKEGLKIKAVALRHKGYSIKEVAKKMDITQSTVSLWFRHVRLSKSAQARLDAHSRRGSLRGVAANRRNRLAVLLKIRAKARRDFAHLGWKKSEMKLACALLFWAEGNKDSSLIGFTNSDPQMMAVFVNLLRGSFDIDESKFRILVHLHEYHDDLKQRRFWSKVTGIGLKQFSKSYIKPHTGKNKRKNYPGCASLRYYDHRIAVELASIYNIIGKKFRRVA